MNPDYDALFAKAREVAEDRGQRYGTIADPLANIHRAAALLATPVWKHALGQAAEGIARLAIIAERGLLTFELAEEYLRDAANHLNFAYLDLRGEANGQAAPQAAEHWTVSGNYDRVPIVAIGEGCDPEHAYRRNDHAHHPRGEAVGRHDGWPNHYHGGREGRNDGVVYEGRPIVPEYLDGPTKKPHRPVEYLNQHSPTGHHTYPRADHHHGSDRRTRSAIAQGWPCHSHGDYLSDKGSAFTYGPGCE